MLLLGPRVPEEGSKLAVHSSACLPWSWACRGKHKNHINKYYISCSDTSAGNTSDTALNAGSGISGYMSRCASPIQYDFIALETGACYFQAASRAPECIFTDSKLSGDKMLNGSDASVPSSWSVKAAGSGWRGWRSTWQGLQCRVQRGAAHSLADTPEETAHLLAPTGDCNERTGGVTSYQQDAVT